jgi:hypothetical protein
VSSRRLSRVCGGVALVAVLLSPAGCGQPADEAPTAGTAAGTPDSADDLEPLIVTEVPSGLPRLPDDDLHPPAGAKRVEDIASYSDDPAREREVLADYGYRFGWERFWGHGTGPVTGVFVDRFEDGSGAASYAEDLARNDAELYGGMLRESPRHLPGGCWLLTVEDAVPEEELSGPAAMVWCAHGAFSVSVTAVAGSVDAAEGEVRAVLDSQLERLPPQ